jgi:hypothetical protein
LSEEFVEDWTGYLKVLKDNNVKIQEVDDQLIWSLDPTRIYVHKIGYISSVEEGLDGQHA